MINFAIIQFLIFLLARVQAQTTCQASGSCSDGITVYSCAGCSNGVIAQGVGCPPSTDPGCQQCTLTANSVTHTFTYDPAATAVINVDDVPAMFTKSDSCTAIGSCTITSASSQVTVAPDGELSVDVASGLLNAGVSVECSAAGSTATSSVTIIIQCGSNSTSFTASSFATTVTADLLPLTTPTFSFTPYTVSDSNCPLSSTVGSDSSAATWSSHFVQSTTGNELTIVAGERFLRRSLSFFIVFSATGGASTSVAATLVTRCVAGSVPLALADYPAQQAEIGSSSVYYESSEIVPTVTGCPVQAYHVGSASDHTATLTGLNSAVTTSGGNFRIAPSDATAKLTYQFYIWIELQDSAYSSVGPVELRVGCSNYIDATLSQDTVAQAQIVIGSQGTADKLELEIDQTNVNIAGSYKLNLNGFTSTKPADCLPDIATYTLSTSNTDSTLTVTEASLDPYTAGDANFELTLATSSLGTYQFYIWGQDSETRWDNVGISSLLTIEVKCGSEAISTTQSSLTEVLALSASSPTIDFSSQPASLFSTTKAPCPITNFEFYSDAGLSSSWSDSFMTITGSNLVQTGTVDVAAPAKRTVYLKGISSGGSSASLTVEVVVCGNELITAASSDTHSMLDNASGSSTFQIVDQTMIETFFTIDSSANSHDNCLIGSLSLSAHSNCIPAYTGSALTVVQSPPQLKLSTQNPVPFETAYFCLTSKGNKVASKKIEAEVCGGETAVISDPSVTEVALRYSRGSGTLGKQTILFSTFNSTLKSSSSNCPLASYAIVAYDEGAGVASPYTGSVASMLTSKDIEISTQQVGLSYFHVEGASTSGSKAYLKFKIEIFEVITEEFLATINTAPFFASMPNEVAVEQELAQATSISIALPEIKDSTSNFCGLFIKAGSLPPFFASNSSNVTEWDSAKASSTSSYFAYSFSQNALTMTVPAAETEAWNNMTLLLTLVDQNRASSTTPLTLTVASPPESESLNQVEPVTPEEDKNDEENGDSEKDTPSTSLDPVQHITQPKASIKGLTTFGELTVGFSEPIKTEGISLMGIGARQVQLYVRPANDWHLRTEGVDPSTLNLTWSATSLTPDDFKLLIEWNSPSSLSPNVELDDLVLHIQDEALFISAKSLVALGKESRTLKVKIPRQLKKTKLAESVGETAQVTKSVMKGATWTALGLNLVLSGFLNMMLGLINSLQLIVHLPVFNVAFPPNAYIVFSSLIPIVTFDLLEAFQDQVDKALEFIGFKFEEEEESDQEVPQQFQNVGFEAFQPMSNLGTLGILVLFYLVKVVLFILSVLVTKLTGRGKKFETALRNQLFFTEILLIFIEGYLDFCLAAFLFLSGPSIGGGLNWSTLGFVAILAFGVIPGALLWIGTLPAEKFKDEAFKRKWGVLFEDIRTQEVGQRLFFLVFVVRRLAYVLIAFTLREHPGLQIIGLNLTNLGMLIYQGYFKPIQSRLRNWIEASNEGLMCLACFHLMAFTDMVPDKETQALCGWSMATLVGVQITFNFGTILKTFVIQIAHKAGILLKRLKQKFEPKQAPLQSASVSSSISDLDDNQSSSDSTPATNPQVDKLPSQSAFMTPDQSPRQTPRGSELQIFDYCKAHATGAKKPAAQSGLIELKVQKKRQLFKKMPVLPTSSLPKQPQDNLSSRPMISKSASQDPLSSTKRPPRSERQTKPGPPPASATAPLAPPSSSIKPSTTAAPHHRPQGPQISFGAQLQPPKPVQISSATPNVVTKPWVKHTPSMNLTFGD